MCARCGHPVVPDGLGTALKPATEFWILARKPLAESSVAGQVLATGTGALNIDASRIAGAWTTWRKSDGTVSERAGSMPFTDTPAVRQGEHAAGRWPANLVLTHAEGCRQVGTRTVRTGTAGPKSGGIGAATVYSPSRTNEAGISEPQSYANADGSEQVEAWECVEGCPVAELDRQSGVLKSGANPVRRSSQKFGGPVYDSFPGEAACVPARGADAGGASRFFYTAKAGSDERSAGLDQVGELPGLHRNHHPTVKPLDLMRWFVKLITPPDGVVLDMFAGSGTTLVAARKEGFRSIGIEREAEYVELIRGRIGAVALPLLDLIEG